MINLQTDHEKLPNVKCVYFRARRILIIGPNFRCYEPRLMDFGLKRCKKVSKATSTLLRRTVRLKFAHE